ncbi:MAG: response regulator [Anaerolineae bacterium]|nr:response regulator [Anaerolineae bacterium]
MAHILVIDDDASLLHMVRLMLERQGHTVTTVTGPQDGLAIIQEQPPDLVILDLMMPGMSGYTLTRTLRKNPQTARLPILILSARAQPIDQQMAFEAGANAYLTKPITGSILTARIKELFDELKAAPTPPVETVPQPSEASQSLPPQHPSRHIPIGAEEALALAADLAGALPVTTVISLRGGSGATTVAVNFAMMLAHYRHSRVCLIDFSATGGHIGLHLHMIARQNWSALLDCGDAPDAKAIASIIAPHPASGLSVMAAPSVPSLATLSQNSVVHVLNVLSGGFQEVVVDVDTLNPAAVGALLAARRVLLVIGDDVTSVHTARHTLQTLRDVGVEPSRVHIILNRSRPDTAMPTNTVVKAIDHPLAAEIPYEADQLQAMRRGTPLVVASPDSLFSKAFQHLLEAI